MHESDSVGGFVYSVIGDLDRYLLHIAMYVAAQSSQKIDLDADAKLEIHAYAPRVSYVYRDCVYPNKDKD
jgi:hypothetical protein